MIDIDRNRLRSDLAYRVSFARQFIGFSQDDADALHAAAPLVAPLVKGVVDEVYTHLFEFSYTKESFLPHNTGFEGDRPANLADLTLDDPQIAFRKKFLTVWATKVFTSDYNSSATWEYLDKVGLMHTGVAGFKHREKKPALFVDLLACSLLLGWVETVLITAIAPLNEKVLSAEMKLQVLVAVNKILWIQQDLFQRHYVRTDEEFASYRSKNVAPREHALIPAQLLSSLPVVLSLGAALGAMAVKALST